MTAAAMVALVESIGTFKAASRFGSATPTPPSVLSRGAGWLGIGFLIDGLFGAASGSTASVENVGLLALTRVGSRRVIQISTGFMLFFSILGKFGAVLASIPLPIFGALYCLLFAFMFLPYFPALATSLNPNYLELDRRIHLLCFGITAAMSLLGKESDFFHFPLLILFFGFLVMYETRSIPVPRPCKVRKSLNYSIHYGLLFTKSWF